MTLFAYLCKLMLYFAALQAFNAVIVLIFSKNIIFR
tara:strand:+ start:9745 stop:9852 length:108 start_codon:yes stop_codon:yes gene_type:complete